MVLGALGGGSDAVLVSHWPVNSEATRIWMEAFYRSAVTESLTESAREAIRAVREDSRYDHPYFWGGFFLVGR